MNCKDHNYFLILQVSVIITLTLKLVSCRPPLLKSQQISNSEVKFYSAETQRKLFSLIGFGLLRHNNDNQEKQSELTVTCRNGHIQLITQNEDFALNFLPIVQQQYRYPVTKYKSVLHLVEAIGKSESERKDRTRSSLSVPRWTVHKVATVVSLDHYDIKNNAKGQEKTEMTGAFDQLSGPTRRGEFIFVGMELDLLTFLKESQSMTSYKSKNGLSIDSGKVMTVPLIYQGEGQLRITENVPEVDSRQKINLRGRHIRISGSKMPPYCDVRIEGGKKVFSGTNYAIIHSASLKYNFTYSLDAPKGKSPGVKLKNGTWIGMLKDVKDGVADITIVNAYNVERFHVIDFTTAFSVTNLVYVTSHPKKEVSLAAITYPYTPFVWFLIGLMFLLVIPAYFISFWFNPYGANRHFSQVLFKSIFIPYVLGVRQDARIPHGLNFLSLVWITFILLIGIGYESNLVSYLSFPEPGTIPTDFFQLSKQSQYAVHFNIFSNIGRSLFRKGSSEMLKKLNAKFLSEAPTIDCVIAAFAYSHAACVGWNDILNSAIAKNLTLTVGLDPLFMSQHSLVNNWLAFGLRKDSQYTEAFGYIASCYGVTGLINRWKEEIMTFYRNIGQGWMSRQGSSSLYQQLNDLAQGGENDPKPFKMENVQISFILFFTGIFISSFVFAGEMGGSRKTRSLFKQAVEKFPAAEMKRLILRKQETPQLNLLDEPEYKHNLTFMSTFTFEERPKSRPTTSGGHIY